METTERLQRRLERERAARKAAEAIAEDKTRQLFAANAELQSTLGYLTAILDHMADDLGVFDTRKRVKMVNPAALRDFGTSEDAVLGADCRDVFGPLLADQLDACEASGAPARFELALPGNRVGMAVVSPIYAEQTAASARRELLGFVALIRDITEAKEIDRVKTEFISNVSHELRTPLTSILGFTNIIRRKLQRNLLPVLQTSEDPRVAKATEQVSGNLDIIIAEGERLSKLINDVLDVAKMEAGKLEWRMAPLEPAALVERVVAATASLFPGEEVVLVTDVEPGLPRVVGDLDRLIQVLINLISNAAKFTSAGTVTCQVRHQPREGLVVFRVIDTGMGIAPEHLPLVFEKFKQVGDTLTDKPKGTGLGLPISKQIVQHHDGHIWAESTPGAGSTFAFTLPAEAAGETTPASTEDLHALLRQVERQVSPARRTLEPHAKTVLVVDDEPSIRELLRQELASAGYAVEEACDGLEAIEKAKLLSPDLIILDVMMPTISGFDAAAVLKNDPQTQGIPIVIHSIIEDRERGDRVGIDRYLTKPTATEVLLDEVQGVLSGKREEPNGS